MKLISILLIAAFLSLIQCRKAPATVWESPDIIDVFPERISIKISKSGNIKTWDDAEVLKQLEEHREKMEVHVANDVTMSRFFMVTKGIESSGNGSVKVILNNDPKISATLEFALSDDNKIHWQYKIFDKLLVNSDSPFTGFHSDANISWIRVALDTGSVILGGKSISIVDFKDILKATRAKHDRVAVGIIVRRENDTVEDLVKVMKITEQENCKAFISFAFH